MSAPIPEAWRNDVIRVLQTCDSRYIEWTPMAFQQWNSDTFGSGWRQVAYEAVAAALSVEGVEGNETSSMAGQLATHEFLFEYRQTRMYGKIALRNNRQSTLILSAHRALRNTLLP